MLTDEEKQIMEVIIAARKLEEYLWWEYNGQWNIEEWRGMFRKRIQKIDDIDVNNPHANIEMRKRLMQNAALSVALMKILDTKGIPTNDCDIPSNLPQYASNIESNWFKNKEYAAVVEKSSKKKEGVICEYKQKRRC